MDIMESLEKFRDKGPYEGQEIFLRNIKIVNRGNGLGINIPAEEIRALKIEEQEIFDVLLIRTLRFGKKKIYKDSEPLLKKMFRERKLQNGQ